MPNHDVSCSHSNRDLFTCEDNMLFSHVKISCFRAKAHLVLHWYLYNKAKYLLKLQLKKAFLFITTTSRHLRFKTIKKSHTLHRYKNRADEKSTRRFHSSALAWALVSASNPIFHWRIATIVWQITNQNC